MHICCGPDWVDEVENGGMLPARDGELVRIVDRTLADAAERAKTANGASWLTCRPGCTPCCHGVFRISALDAERLRTGLRELEHADRPRADGIRTRAQALVGVLRAAFPGDAQSGVLAPEEDDGWDDFADLAEADAACPVLDPATGRCELYAHRPLTCRVFGPPVRNKGGIGVCELCYVGATEAEVLAGEMKLEHGALEEELDGEMPGETVIAWAVLAESR